LFIDADDSVDLPVQPGDSVNIQTDASVRVNIVGEARNPGVHELYEGQGAIEALAAGGGETDKSALSRAKIIRHGKEIPVDLYKAVIDGDSSKNVVMEDNDTLEIPQQYAKIAVSGQVGRPGTQLLPDGRPYTLADAIGEAGGAGAHSKREKIQLIRVGPDGKAKATDYNLKLLGTKNHPNPELQDKDVIFVPESGAPNLGDISGFANLFWLVRTFAG
jgi:polysaccharide export outer membrane protein